VPVNGKKWRSKGDLMAAEERGEETETLEAAFCLETKRKKKKGGKGREGI